MFFNKLSDHLLALTICFIFSSVLCSSSQGKSVKVCTKNIYQRMDANQGGIEGMEYIIKRKCDLKGGVIVVPENCTLRFKGGYLKNGIIIFNKTRIDGKHPDFREVSFDGTLGNESVNVSWFNVKSDVSEVVNKLVKSPTIKEIRLPRGIFLVRNTIYLRSDLTLIGDGENTVLQADRSYLQQTPNRYVMLSTVTQRNIIQGMHSLQYENESDYHYSFENIKIENLCFDLNYKGGENVGGQMAALKIEDAQNVSIRHCWFKDHSTEPKNHTYHALYIVKSKDCVISNCHTENISFAHIIKSDSITCSHNIGINSIGTWIESNDGNNLKYYDNKLTEVCSLTSAISFNSRNCIAERNIIHTSTPIVCGIVLGHPDTSELNNSADGCIVRNNCFDILGNGRNDYGILVQNARNVIISNNIITSSGNTVRISDGNDAIIDNNRLTHTCVTSSNLYINTNREVTICGNIILDNGDGVPQNYNQVVYLACNRAILEGNTIETKAHEAKYNVIWAVPGNTTRALVLRNNFLDGISIMGHVSDLLITDNTFKDVTTHLFTNSVNTEGTTRFIVVKNNNVSWREGTKGYLVYLTGKVDDSFKTSSNIQVEDNIVNTSRQELVRYQFEGDRIKGIRAQNINNR